MASECDELERKLLRLRLRVKNRQCSLWCYFSADECCGMTVQFSSDWLGKQVMPI